jgi:rod shape-determining protein MreB
MSPLHEPGVFCVGIDLGTSRSSISAESGQRGVIESYVGWPADMVARKALQREVLVGLEALENRLMLDLRRPLERGLIKEGSERDGEAVSHLLRHLLVAVGVPDLRARGTQVRAVVGVPAEAMRRNKLQVRAALGGLVDAVMVVSEPFAVAYGLEALANAMVVDIGAGTADLCVMKGRYPRPEDQASLIHAGDAVDALLAQLVQARHPQASFSLHMARGWKERHSFVGPAPNGGVWVTAPVAGRPTGLEITEEMRRACESLVAPIIEAMLDLLSRVEPEYQEKVRQQIVLSGGSALMPGLGAALEAGLAPVGGGRVRVVLDPIFVGSNGGLAIALDAPDEDWERLAS